MQPVIHLNVGDKVILKKQHPCGNREFRILRVGSDIRSICTSCGREVTLDRLKFEKSIKSILSSDPEVQNHE